MQPKHAGFIGGSAVVIVAAIYSYLASVLIALANHTTIPAFDANVSAAFATLTIWGVAMWAAKNNVTLPPEIAGNGNGNGVVHPTPPAEPAPQKT